MPTAPPLTTTLSTKGQVILPAAIRNRQHWSPGTKLTVEETPEGVLLKAATRFPLTTPDQVFGSLHYPGEPKSLEEMQQGVVEEVRRRHARGRY